MPYTSNLSQCPNTLNGSETIVTISDDAIKKDCSFLKKHITLSNAVLVGKIVIIGFGTIVIYEAASGLYNWYNIISSPIGKLETAASTEYHTLQTKYDYRWYDYFCPMCLLSKYMANSNNKATTQAHHNHVMHAMNGNILAATGQLLNGQQVVVGWPANAKKSVVSINLNAISPGTGVATVTATCSLFAMALQVDVDNTCNSNIITAPHGIINITVSATTSSGATCYFALNIVEYDISLLPQPTRVIVDNPVNSVSILGTPSVSVVGTPNVSVVNQPIDVQVTGPPVPVEVSNQPVDVQLVGQPAAVEVTGLPLWTTQYGPTAATTRCKQRHSRDNSIAILNQIASQDVHDKRLPLYSKPIKCGSDDQPQWGISVVYRDITENAVGGKTIHAAKTACASRILERLSESSLNRDQRLTLNSWERDTTMDGDVESNPGPEFEYLPDTGLTEDELAMLRSMKPKIETAVINDNPALLDDLTEFQQCCDPSVFKPRGRRSAAARKTTIDPPQAVTPIKELSFDEEKSRYTDHIIAMQKVKGEVGEYFESLAYIIGISTSNKFTILASCDDIPAEPTYEAEKYNKPQKISRQTADIEERPKRKPQSDKTKIKTEEEKVAERNSCIERITAKLLKDRCKIIDWVEKPMSHRFKLTILERCFGANWQDRTEMDQYEWVAYCNINKISHHEKMRLLVEYDIKFQNYSLKAIESVCNYDSDAAKTKTHNKVMHAYNGNPLVQTFSEVLSMPTTESLAKESESVMLPYTGIEAEKYLTNIVGDVNPNQSRIFDQDRLRGNIATAGGGIIQNAMTALPFTNLIPRTVRDANGVLVDSQHRMRITECNVSEYFVNPIVPTELSGMISDQIKNNQASNWRRDNTSLAGFSSFDIASVNTALLPRGLSLESMLLKIDLLHSIMALRVDSAMIGRSLYQIIDDNTVPSNNQPNAVIGFNDSPVFGEDCGGINAEYPWVGGNGRIAFHLTLQTVPEERRENAVFMPSGLLQASIDGAEAIALFVLSMTEWPFGLYTVSQVTEDINGQNQAPQMFMPMQTVTRVCGLDMIDVILPRRYAVANPTAQQAANALAVVRPRTGPAASALLAANQDLNINFVQVGPVIEYPLTEFLYTWALAFDITSIRQYVGRLASMLGVKKQYWACHEINVALCQVAPKMTTGLNGGGEQPANSPQQFDYCYSSLLQVTQAQEDFPLDGETAADFRIFETSIGTWNKVVLGLATADNLSSEQNMHVPFEVGDPRSNFWERLEAIPIAVSWSSYFHCRGVTSLAWNNAYTNQNNVWLQRMARNSYSTSQTTGTILPARYGAIPKNIMKSMYQRMPASVETSVGGELYHITHFERWLPGNNYATVYDPVGNEVTVFPPVLIPDIWSQYSSIHCPLMNCSYPPVYGYDSVQGFNNKDGLLPFRNVNNDLVSTYVEPFVANQGYFPIKEGPNMNDKVIWNSRLWMTQGNVQYLDYAGNQLVEVLPPPGHLPLGKAIPLLPGENPPDGVCNMATTCVPRYSNDGRRIFVFLTAAQSVLPIQACKRGARLARSAWLLGEVYREPELQLCGDETPDIFETLTSKAFLDVTKAAAISAEDNIPATKAMTDMQAIDPSTLPTTLDKSTPMLQPAPSLATT